MSTAYLHNRLHLVSTRLPLVVHPRYCRHQKTWVIDVGTGAQVAFVEGINFNSHSVVAPSHHGEGQNHDVYVELAGSAVSDVQHNFVQRWNKASERHAPDGYWGADAASDLPFPDEAMPERGRALVQIQRTIHPGRCHDGRAPIGGRVLDVAAGGRANLEQYCLAIRSGRCTIYMENQYLEVPEIVEALRDALENGVGLWY